MSQIFGICLVIVSIVDASRAHHASFSASLATLMLVSCVYMIMSGYQLFTLRWQSQTAVNYVRSKWSVYDSHFKECVLCAQLKGKTLWRPLVYVKLS